MLIITLVNLNLSRSQLDEGRLPGGTQTPSMRFRSPEGSGQRSTVVHLTLTRLSAVGGEEASGGTSLAEHIRGIKYED